MMALRGVVKVRGEDDAWVCGLELGIVRRIREEEGGLILGTVRGIRWGVVLRLRYPIISFISITRTLSILPRSIQSPSLKSTSLQFITQSHTSNTTTTTFLPTQLNPSQTSINSPKPNPPANMTTRDDYKDITIPWYKYLQGPGAVREHIQTEHAAGKQRRASSSASASSIQAALPDLAKIDSTGSDRSMGTGYRKGSISENLGVGNSFSGMAGGK